MMKHKLTIIINAITDITKYYCYRSIVDEQSGSIGQIILLSNNKNSQIVDLCHEWKQEDERITVIDISNKPTVNFIEFLSKIKENYCYFLSVESIIPDNFFKKMLLKAQNTKSDIIINRPCKFVAMEDDRLSVPLWEQSLITPDKNIFNIDTSPKYIFNYTANCNSQILYKTDFLRKIKISDFDISYFWNRKLPLFALVYAKSVTYSDIYGLEIKIPLSFLEQAQTNLKETEKLIYEMFVFLKKLPQAELLIQSFANFVILWITNLYNILLEPIRSKYITSLIKLSEEFNFLDKSKHYFHDSLIYFNLFNFYKTKLIYPTSTHKNIIPIFITCNNHKQTIVAGIIVSAIKKHSDINKFYDIYIVCADNKDTNLHTIFDYQTTDNISVRIIDVKKYNVLKLFGIDLLKPEYLQIKVPLMSSYSKIICLSTNILPLCDISLLADISLKDNILAAAQLYGSRELIEKQQNLIYETFISSDVMLIDTILWKANHLSLIGELKINTQNKNIMAEQQNIINHICFGNILALSPKWNTLLKKAHNIYDTDKYPRHINQMQIINFNDKKPWENPLSPFANIWWQYARISPSYEYILTDFKPKQTPKLVLDTLIVKKILSRYEDFFPQILTYTKEKILSFITFGKKSKIHKHTAENTLQDIIRRVI